MLTFEIRVLSALCAIAAAVCPSSAAEPEVVTFQHQDVVRTAVLHVPAPTVGSAAPLVIALHRAGSTGKGFRAGAARVGRRLSPTR